MAVFTTSLHTANTSTASWHLQCEASSKAAAHPDFSSYRKARTMSRNAAHFCLSETCVLLTRRSAP